MTSKNGYLVLLSIITMLFPLLLLPSCKNDNQGKKLPVIAAGGEIVTITGIIKTHGNHPHEEYIITTKEGKKYLIKKPVDKKIALSIDTEGSFTGVITLIQKSNNYLPIDGIFTPLEKK